MNDTSLELSVGCGRKSIPEKQKFINEHPFHALNMGRSLMTLMASGLGGFGLYTEIIGTSACIECLLH